MQTIGYALIELSSGSIVQSFGSRLPVRIELESSVSFMDAPGQVIPDSAAPTHMLVERVSEPAPGPDYVLESSSETFDGSKVVVTRTWTAPTPYVPDVVTPYQARVALLNAGLLDAVAAMMESTDVDPAAKIAWEYATGFYRNSPFIVSLRSTLGLTPEQIDALFIAASEVE